MTKRNRNKPIRPQSNESAEIIRFAKVLGVVIVLILGVYFFTRVFVTKDLFNKKNTEAETPTEVTIDYGAITLGSLFNKADKEYYVIVFANSSLQAPYYNSIYKKYAEKEKSLPIFLADLDDPFNKSFYDSKESNPKAMSASDIKVGDVTLIRVKDGKITKYLEDKDSITKELE